MGYLGSQNSVSCERAFPCGSILDEGRRRDGRETFCQRKIRQREGCEFLETTYQLQIVIVTLGAGTNVVKKRKETEYRTYLCIPFVCPSAP